MKLGFADTFCPAPDLIRSCKNFTFERMKLTKYFAEHQAIFKFEWFQSLKSLEVVSKDIESDWNLVVNGVRTIPSKNFSKLIVHSELFKQESLNPLIETLQQKKLQFTVEVRCATLIVLLDEFLKVQKPKGFKRVVDKVKSHRILRFYDKSANLRINLFVSKETIGKDVKA